MSEIYIFCSYREHNRLVISSVKPKVNETPNLFQSKPNSSEVKKGAIRQTRPHFLCLSISVRAVGGVILLEFYYPVMRSPGAAEEIADA